jgi:hypothetical protein
MMYYRIVPVVRMKILLFVVYPVFHTNFHVEMVDLASAINGDVMEERLLKHIKVVEDA